MPRISKTDLLSGKALRTLEVDLPQFGGTIKMREPSSAAAMRVRSLQKEAKAKGVDTEADMMAEMISSTVLDENNNLMFSKPDALQFLDRISLETATLFIQKFNELAVPPKKDEPEGNSEPSQSAS